MGVGCGVDVGAGVGVGVGYHLTCWSRCWRWCWCRGECSAVRKTAVFVCLAASIRDCEGENFAVPRM